MLHIHKSDPNPDLHVGADLRQNWNRPENRRQAFHSAHLIFRRAQMIRSRRVLRLNDQPDAEVAACATNLGLSETPGFSALVVAEQERLLFAKAANDFTLDRPHSIQSVTKMHMHLIAGKLIEAGRLDLDACAGCYLPELGTGYRDARIRDILDMNVANNFSENYADPEADCYREEEALGWRLPPDNRAEMTLMQFVCGITSEDLTNRSGYVLYKSANIDVLTLIAARLTNLDAILTEVCDAVGYAGALHISQTPEGLPAFSGGGCLSPLDLARFGLLFARLGRDAKGSTVGSPEYLQHCLTAKGPPLSLHQPGQRYSGGLMTDGRFIGHTGYGGQCLLVDLQTGRVAVYLGVIENDSGYDEALMSQIVGKLSQLVSSPSASSSGFCRPG